MKRKKQPTLKVLKKKNRTLERNNDIVKMIDELFNKKRIRYDDVIQKVAKHFYLAEQTIVNILKREPKEGYLSLLQQI